MRSVHEPLAVTCRTAFGRPRDHEAPFTGGIDFEKLVPLLPTNCLFVWEMSPNKTADAIRQSVRMWKERFGE